MEIRDLNERTDRRWADAMVSSQFGTTSVVSRGRLHDTTTLPSLVALVEGRRSGLLQYRIDGGSCEVVTLVVSAERQGLGRALMRAAEGIALRHGCTRLWLVTTNDNITAQAFYKAIGWRQRGIHKGAIAAARKLKPDIPATGSNGIPIEDEIEFERAVTAPL